MAELIKPKDYPTPNVPDDTDLLAESKKWTLDILYVPNKFNVKFKAMLTSFSDGFEQRWNDDHVYGRMDPISAYQGTGRTINVGWTIPAASIKEAALNLQNLSKLAHFMYPDFEDLGPLATTIASAPLLKIKFGNLITHPNCPPGGTALDSGLLCRTDGFQWEPDLDAGMFDPAPGVLLPKKIDLSMTLIVLHQHSLGFSGEQLRNGGQGFPYNVETFKGGETSGTQLNESGDPDETGQFTDQDIEAAINIMMTNVPI